MSAHIFRGALSPAIRSLPLLRLLAGARKPKGRVVDPESLSDHMLRDLGLLGGRDTPPRDIMRD